MPIRIIDNPELGGTKQKCGVFGKIVDNLEEHVRKEHGESAGNKSGKWEGGNDTLVE